MNDPLTVGTSVSPDLVPRYGPRGYGIYPEDANASLSQRRTVPIDQSAAYFRQLKQDLVKETPQAEELWNTASDILDTANKVRTALHEMGEDVSTDIDHLLCKHPNYDNPRNIKAMLVQKLDPDFFDAGLSSEERTGIGRRVKEQMNALCRAREELASVDKKGKKRAKTRGGEVRRIDEIDENDPRDLGPRLTDGQIRLLKKKLEEFFNEDFEGEPLFDYKTENPLDFEKAKLADLKIIIGRFPRPSEIRKIFNQVLVVKKEYVVNEPIASKDPGGRPLVNKLYSFKPYTRVVESLDDMRRLYRDYVPSNKDPKKLNDFRVNRIIGPAGTLLNDITERSGILYAWIKTEEAASNREADVGHFGMRVIFYATVQKQETFDRFLNKKKKRPGNEELSAEKSTNKEIQEEYAEINHNFAKARSLMNIVFLLQAENEYRELDEWRKRPDVVYGSVRDDEFKRFSIRYGGVQGTRAVIETLNSHGFPSQVALEVVGPLRLGLSVMSLSSPMYDTHQDDDHNVPGSMSRLLTVLSGTPEQDGSVYSRSKKSSPVSNVNTSAGNVYADEIGDAI